MKIWDKDTFKKKINMVFFFEYRNLGFFVWLEDWNERYSNLKIK